MGLSRVVMGLSIVVMGLTSVVSADVTVFLERGGDWSYLQGLSEASSPDPESWRTVEFDDSSWSVGVAPFGFGSTFVPGTDLSLLDPPMRSNYVSLFLRRTFEVPEPDRLVEFHVDINYDDAAIIWINGVEAVRTASAPGAPGEFVTFNTQAARSHSSRTAEDIAIPDPLSLLVQGTNTIAVQVFNRTLSGTDLSLDLALLDPVGPDLTAPTVTRTLPLPTSTVRALSQIEILFDEPVQGLDVGDLTIDGQPAASISGSDAGPYLFSFDEPPVGAVAVAWAANHGIEDVSPDHNSFGGGSWSYTLDPNAPPPRVIINEVLAANRSDIDDEEGDKSGWIELFNDGGEPVDITNWGLTDDPSNPTKWLLPAMALGPQEYLLVFASGKDRSVEGEELHTNFLVSKNGEYLGLFDSQIPRVAVSELAPAPEQRVDVGYGLDNGGQFAYLEPPTPGASNSAATASSGLVAKPKMSIEHGFYEQPFEVLLETATPDAEIRYTTDGSAPTATTGEVYGGSLTIDQTTPLRAAAFKPGLVGSKIATRTYVFPADVITQPRLREDVINDPAYSGSIVAGLKSIPTLSVAMSPGDLVNLQSQDSRSRKEELSASIELIYADGVERLENFEGLQTDCAIEGHSWALTKRSYRLKFKRSFGPSKLDYPFFESAPVHADSAAEQFDRIVLRAGKNVSWHAGQQANATFLRDPWARDAQVATSGAGSRSTFVHLYLNGAYWGLYNPSERPDSWFTSTYLGGQKEDWFSTNHGYERGDGHLTGDPSRFNEMVSTASARNLEDPQTYTDFQQLVNLDQYIDYVILFWFIGFGDGIDNNWYGGMRLNPAGGFNIYIWDAEASFLPAFTGPAGHNGAWVPDYFFSGNETIVNLWQALIENADFRLRFADRIYKHCFNNGSLTAEQSLARLQAGADFIEDAVIGESARWGAGRTRDDDWRRALERLSGVMESNVPRMISAVRRNTRGGGGLYPPNDPPFFSQHGGSISAGFDLAMELPEETTGTILFTIDGSDPRVPVTGEVSTSAQEYSAPVTLSDSAFVRARTLTDGVWSALNEAVFTVEGVSPADLLITEIHYHPASDGDAEFLEIYNPTALAIDLSGVEFTNGVSFTFAPGATLGAGEFLVLGSDALVFDAIYPGAELAGIYSGKLSNGGEKLTLSSADGETIFSVDYNDSGFWPISPDGFGYSLVLANADGDPDDASSWRASGVTLGTPGTEDPGPGPGGVFVNEVVVGGAGAVELYNETGGAVDVGGWFLSPVRDDAAALKQTTLAAGSTIPAGGYLVLQTGDIGFPIDPLGGALYLSSADGSGVLTGHIAKVEYGATEPGSAISFGRYETSTGIDFTALAATTLGADNSEAAVPAVAINEVHYHPADGGIEFIEFHNPNNSTVDLSGWRLSGVTDPIGLGSFLFPAGSVVRGQGFLLLVPTDPEVFRADHGIPAGAVVVGPYGGSLQNDGESLELSMPLGGAPDTFIPVDRVRYNDREPWPLEADGNGPSLERILAVDYGNEVLNWGASNTNGGTPGRTNSVSPDLPEPTGGLQLPSDLTQDGDLDITDAILVVGHLFLGSPTTLPCGDGTLADVGNRQLADADGSGGVDVTDVLRVLNFLFLRGPEPVLGTECVRLEGCPDVCP